MRKRAPRESISSPTAPTKVRRQSCGISTAPPPTARAQQGLFASTAPRPTILSSSTWNSGPLGTVSMWLRSTSSLSPPPRVAITEPTPSRCAVSQPKRGRRSASILAASASSRVGLGTATMSTRSPTDSGSLIWRRLPFLSSSFRIYRRRRAPSPPSPRRRGGSARRAARRPRKAGRATAAP